MHAFTRPEHPTLSVTGVSLLAWLLAGDFVVLALHLAFKTTTWLDSPLFNIEVEGGYGENYQHIKYAIIVTALLWLAIGQRCLQFVSWAIIYTYMLCDDRYQIHETVGKYLATQMDFGPHFMLRAQDLGELTVSVVAGFFLAVLLGWAYLRGSAEFRILSKNLLLFAAALAFCGVAVDMLHSMIRDIHILKGIVAIIEDGGELIVVSTTAWYVVLVARTPSLASLSLLPLVRLVSRSLSIGTTLASKARIGPNRLLLPLFHRRDRAP